MNWTWVQFAEFAGVSDRSVRDWANGELKMPYDIAIKLSKKCRITLPKNIKVQTWKEHMNSISYKGGKSNFEKNREVGGNKDYRKEKWNRWWLETGINKNYKILQAKKIKVPDKSMELAEFVGIMMGDGGVAPYHISITLNSETDLRYSNYVSGLITGLFKVKPKVYKDKVCKALDLVVQRKELVMFCQQIGLKLGNKLKQNLDIPDWLRKNDGYCKMCIRGLVDTDGSVFNHSYVVGGKRYNYPKISFCSKSTALINSVFSILNKFGFRARIAKSGSEIWLDNQADVQKYFKVIGTSNPKHLDKIKKVWRDARAVIRTDC